MPLGVILADDQGRCLQANPAVSGILGLERDAILASPLDATLLGTFSAEPAGAIGSGPTVCAWRRDNGEEVWLEIRRQACPDAGTLFFFSDITEARSHKLHLERMTQLYAALSQVNQAIVWSPTREALLAKICEVMVEFGKFRMAWIGWDDPVTHEVAVASHYGDTLGYLDGLQVRSDDTPLGRGGIAIRTGQACVVQDFLGSEDSRPWHGAAVRSNFATSASFPIRMGGQVVGALMVYGAEKELFGPHEIALLEEAAGDISFALDHLELDGRRREAEAALRASEGRLQRAESVAAFGNWEFTLEEGIMHASQGAHLIYGVEEEYLSLAEVQAQVLPEYRPAMDLALRALIEEGRPYDLEFRIRRAGDGQIRVIHSVAEYDASRRAVFGVLHDITARKEIEDRLRESEFFFKESQRAAAIGSYKADFVAGFWESSPVLDSIFGIDETYVRSIEGWVELILPEDRPRMVDHLQREVIAGHRPFFQEYRITRPSDGAVRWVQGLGAGTFDAEGVFLSLMGTIQDITEQKLAEQEFARLNAQLLQAQKMESLGILAGGVAHDMNNVLGAVLALASAHLTTQPQGSPAHRAFATICEAAQRGGDLVKSLLNFARKTPTEKRPLDLNALIREEARLLERTTLAQVQLTLDLVPDLHTIQGDAGTLAHALMNLWINAVDAMDGSGTLTIGTRNLGGGQVEVRVEDTGSGMTQEVLDRALDPFFTTKGEGKGTGLGLSLVYTAVKAHGGKLDIQSAPGEGTRICLRFPVTRAQGAAAQGEPREVGKAPALALTLLLVDDDELVLTSTQMLVEILGHSVETAISGEQALDRLDQGFQPDAIILDMNMPGLGGKGSLPRIRERCPVTPVLLATGRANQEALDLVAAFPHVTLLAKPFTIEEVRERLQIHCSPVGIPG
jgi:PAS domain S-box-containing protein